MGKILKSALARGLLWQFILWLAGALLLTLIRLAMGLAPFGRFLFTEPAWVFGGLLGVMGFLGGSGVVSDWFAWARGIETPEHREDPPGWEKYFNVSLDHKVIGIQYTMTALFLFIVGGSFALVFRTELAATGLQFLTLQWYNTFMS